MLHLREGRLQARWSLTILPCINTFGMVVILQPTKESWLYPGLSTFLFLWTWHSVQAKRTVRNLGAVLDVMSRFLLSTFLVPHKLIVLRADKELIC